MDNYNIVYVSIASFWKNSCIKPYLHHDVIFKYLNRIKPITIHIALPMPGSEYFKKLIDTGRDNRVLTSWRELPYKVHKSLYCGDMDCLFINGNGGFQGDVEDYNGEKFTPKQIADYIVNLALQCKINNLPVVLYDPDNFITFCDGKKKDNISTEETNYTYRVYQLLKDYDKLILASPFEFGLNSECKNKEIFVPFTLDKEVCGDIKPLSEREFFTRYVGSNYYRDNFVPYFKKCSEFGPTEVAGAGWTHYYEECADVIWRRKFPLTNESVYPHYSNSKIGLYGTTSESFLGYGHYTLRVREFYEAGTFIIPEKYDYMINSICTDFFKLNIEDDIMNSDHNPLDGITDEIYNEIVQEQRVKLVEKFDAQQYAELLAERIF